MRNFAISLVISFAAFVLLALCPLTQGFSALQNKADFICPSDGNYAKPGAECTRVYYKCANGTVTEMVGLITVVCCDGIFKCMFFFLLFCRIAR